MLRQCAKAQNAFDRRIVFDSLAYATKQSRVTSHKDGDNHSILYRVIRCDRACEYILDPVADGLGKNRNWSAVLSG